MADTRARLAPDAVFEAIVAAAQGDLNTVHEAPRGQPTLANPAWDWGDGDWELALGAAAHMGRRDIAERLIDHGARLDIGPHGIPLLAHAEQGGPPAGAALDLLADDVI